MAVKIGEGLGTVSMASSEAESSSNGLAAVEAVGEAGGPGAGTNDLWVEWVRLCLAR